MTGAQKRGRLGRVGQFIIFKSLSVSDGICGPFSAMLVHQRQQQPGVKPAAQKYSNRNIA